MIIVEYPVYGLHTIYWRAAALWQNDEWMCNSSRYGSLPPPYTYWVEEYPF